MAKITITDAASLDLSQFLRAGDHIFWGQGCGEPSTLIEALIAQAAGIGNLSGFTATSFSGRINAEAGRQFAMSSMGTVGVLREIAAAGLLGIIPCHIGQIGHFIEAGLIGSDVAFVQVSPADKDGNHSYGLVSDSIRTAVAKARVVIAEVNDQVPFTYCDITLPSDQIDCAIHVSRPPVELIPPPTSESDLAIAKVAADFINDRAVIQVGVGGVPDAILRLLRDRRDLGVHSGMVGDSLVDLIEAGVVTNAAKEFDTGICITGCLMGTKRLYDFAHLNPQIGMRGSDYTHGELTLTRVVGLVTINSALEVDLTGQVNAEQSGSTYLGGTGGQVDYVRGGSRAPRGRSIIALPATAKGGSISRITATLNGPVTTARSEVDVIVTEYGAAELKGQTLPERARRLAAIAHPDFREDLDRAAFAIGQRGF
jgi:acyl-CoA hydrolase